MDYPTTLSRRRTLEAAGATATVVCLAGCGDLGDGDEENDGTNGQEENDDETNDEGVGDEETGDDEADGEWEDVSGIQLIGEEDGWIGVEPEMIEDEQNPTLSLLEDEEYEIMWENGDGSQHNIALRTDAMEIVEEYQTDLLSSFEAEPPASRSEGFRPVGSTKRVGRGGQRGASRLGPCERACSPRAEADTPRHKSRDSSRPTLQR